MIDYNSFLKWEDLDRDVIKVKRLYVDITEDVIAGLLLSQIIYWHLPSKKGKSKLRVNKNNSYWLAKGRNDWWEECRITARQFDRAIDIIAEKGIIEKNVFRFNGSPTVHIKLIPEVLMEHVNSILRKRENEHEKPENLDDYESVNSNLHNGKLDINNNVKTLTKTTTKNTTETKIFDGNPPSTISLIENDTDQNPIKDNRLNKELEVQAELVSPNNDEDELNFAVSKSHLGKESKRKNKIKEKFKEKEISDITARYTKERVMSDKGNVNQPKLKEVRRSSVTIIAYFVELYKEHFGGNPLVDNKKNRSLMKKMIDHYGYETVEKMIEYLFNDWANIKRSYNVKSSCPNISILWGWKDTIYENIKHWVEYDDDDISF